MRGISFGSRLLAIAIAALLVAGCRGAGATGSPSAIPLLAQRRGLAPMDPLHRGPLDKIKHIVIIMQENRTLNNLFFGYPGARRQVRLDSAGKKIALQPVTFATKWDMQHNGKG